MSNTDTISYIAGARSRPCETYFVVMSIFRRIQAFFRGNYFFQPLAPLSVHVGSHPPGKQVYAFWTCKLVKLQSGLQTRLIDSLCFAQRQHSPAEAYTHARTDRVLFLQFLTKGKV